MDALEFTLLVWLTELDDDAGTVGGAADTIAEAEGVSLERCAVMWRVFERTCAGDVGAGDSSETIASIFED